MGEEVRDLLVASLPVDAPIGLFHGDFQTSNLLFDDGVLEAVLDWEISGIGGQRLDIGWLLMMNDPQSWYDAGSFAAARTSARSRRATSRAWARRSATLGGIGRSRGIGSG